MSQWQVRDRFLNLQTRWFALIGEHLVTESLETLEYWRIERADSVVVMPLLEGSWVLPEPMYRPGVGQATLDFPGGRVGPDQTPAETAPQVLQRELGIEIAAIASLTPLNVDGWPINSSFSNQRLYGWVAELLPHTVPTAPCRRFAMDPAGLQALEAQLLCLQCRAVLREWQVKRTYMNVGYWVLGNRPKTQYLSPKT
jgi:8-oxo-dGTP pyrophosphatase MutT (NUDIX family)